MALSNDPVYNVLKQVTDNVYYVVNRDDNSNDTNALPYIVFQVISKHPITADNKAQIYKVEYQVTVVTKKRSEALIHRFETMLNEKELIPVLISTYRNDDYSLNRVYKIETISKGGY